MNATNWLGQFDALVAEFGKAVVIHRAVDAQERTLAAVMSFCFKDTVYAYYSGSSSDSRGKGVSDFVYCKIMEWAVERGYRVFDAFGDPQHAAAAIALLLVAPVLVWN